jgi:hypothetical protein
MNTLDALSSSTVVTTGGNGEDHENISQAYVLINIFTDIILAKNGQPL